MNAFWKNKRVMVTGGAGLIGSHLTKRLLAEGAQLVRAVDNLERGKLDFIREQRLHPNFEFVKADMRNQAEAWSVAEGIDVIYHLASKVGGIRYYIECPGEVFNDNVLIDHNVWSAARTHETPYYLFASSAHVYPIDLQMTPDAPPIVEAQAYPANPELSYGWAKLLGEKLILYSTEQGCTTRAAIPRLIGAYGPNQDVELATGSAIPVFCRRAIEYPKRKPFVVLGTGNETRSFHFISDTVDALLRAVEKLTGHKVLGPFNLGAEGRVTIREIAETVIAISRKSIDIHWDTTHPTAIWGQALDCSLAAQLLDGWRPKVSLYEGIEQCYRHIEERLQTNS